MNPSYFVTIYYKYTPVSDPVGFMRWQRETCERIGMFGRILVAKEGVNGTVEGTSEQLEAYAQALHTQDGRPGTFGDFSDVWFKTSPSTGDSFKKLTVKVRNEIVATGLSEEEDIDPNQLTGTHISPKQMKALIEEGNVEIVDMRNDYEYAVGHFDGSRASGMANFRDLSRIADDLEDLKEKPVITVCTYGVRCEKASGYLKKRGFKNVYQLHGGIGTYMKQYPGEDFLGSLYVFDNRMTEQFTDAYKIIGTCVQCGTTSERFGNCAWDTCHKQLIICETCSPSPVYCSKNCEEGHASCKKT